MTQIIVTTAIELESIIQNSIRKAMEHKGNLEPKSEADSLLSIKEAATFLNLATPTLYGFTSKRIIPFIKRGKKLYFRRSELEQWLLEGKKQSISQIAANIEKTGRF